MSLILHNRSINLIFMNLISILKDLKNPLVSNYHHNHIKINLQGRLYYLACLYSQINLLIYFLLSNYSKNFMIKYIIKLLVCLYYQNIKILMSFQVLYQMLTNHIPINQLFFIISFYYILE